jgi:hypothetical protein
MSQESMDKLVDFTGGLFERVQNAANLRKREAVLAIEMGLTQTTPIDTGAAISNWLVSLDSPREDIIEPYAPSSQGVHSHATHGDVAGAGYNAAGAMELAQAIVAESAPGQAIFIANNDPAIEATDGRGTSPQAAPGYVDRAITSGVDTMSRAKLVV